MLIGFSGITPGTNSIHVAGVSSFGTSTYLADTTVPVQLNATAGVARYFGVNKAGNYGLLVGFDNASGLGTGCHFRCVTTDSIYFFVNNTVQAAQINSSGQWMFNTTTAAGTLAVGAQSSGATVKMTNDTANAGTFVFQTSNSSGVNGSSIQLTHTRGSNASPTATQSGDVLGSVGFGGYGTSINNAGAVIFGVAAQTWTGSANGSDIWFYTTKTGATSNSETFRLSANGNVVCGGNNGAALATSATDGFLYLPTCAGTPTGVPTSYTGRVAALFDTTANKIWVYDGAWLQTAALT
jgi:hypothetical protein